MMAVHSNGMDTVNINVQKLELAQSMFSEDDYIDSAANDDLKASLESMGITVTDMSVIEENFMGKSVKLFLFPVIFPDIKYMKEFMR